MFRVKFAPAGVLPDKIDESILQRVEGILSGEWSIEDVLELQVDEISTSGSVGPGVSKSLMTVKDDRLKKLKGSYEKYLERKKRKSSPSSVKEFFNEVAPGSSESVIRNFSMYISSK